MTTTKTPPEHWPLYLTRRQQLPKRGNGHYLTVEAGLHYLPGNREPYFSVTGHIATAAQERRGDWETGGCIHDEILAMFPDLAPIIALHLSGESGEPMHAEANGWYWLAGALGGMGERYHGGNGKCQHWLPGGAFDGYRESTPDECLATFAKHCRVSMTEAEAIRQRVKNASSAGNGNARKSWRAICDGMIQRWQAERDEAKALLVRLGATERL